MKEANILDTSQCAILCAFLDFMWRETQGDQGWNRFDMRVHLTDAAFISLLSAVSKESLSIALFASFQELFEQIPGASGEC